jgi:hypothetical protein
MSTVLAYVPDLMDRSRVHSALADVTFAASVDDLAEAVRRGGVDLVLVDLGRPGVLDAVAAATARVVGFASHVDDAVLSAARDHAIEALPRSVFFRRLPSGFPDGGGAATPPAT